MTLRKVKKYVYDAMHMEKSMVDLHNKQEKEIVKTPVNIYSGTTWNNVLMGYGYKHEETDEEIVIRPLHYHDDPNQLIEFTHCRELFISKTGALLLSKNEGFKKRILGKKNSRVCIVLVSQSGVPARAPAIKKILNKIEIKAGWSLTKVLKPKVINPPPCLDKAKIKVTLIEADSKYTTHPALISLLIGLFIKTKGELKKDFGFEDAVKGIVNFNNWELVPLVEKLVVNYDKLFKDRTMLQNYKNTGNRDGLNYSNSILGPVKYRWSSDGISKFLSNKCKDMQLRHRLYEIKNEKAAGQQ